MTWYDHIGATAKAGNTSGQRVAWDSLSAKIEGGPVHVNVNVANVERSRLTIKSPPTRTRVHPVNSEWLPVPNCEVVVMHTAAARNSTTARRNSGIIQHNTLASMRGVLADC